MWRQWCEAAENQTHRGSEGTLILGRRNMGIYLNPGNEGFQSALRSQIYVDKTGMLAYTNSVLDTEQRYICVSRPRRFGKSITAEMLAAYYDRSCGGLSRPTGL